MNCRQCGKRVEASREVYAIPTCFACLPPPMPLPEMGCECLACKQLDMYQAESWEARKRDVNDP